MDGILFTGEIWTRANRIARAFQMRVACIEGKSAVSVRRREDDFFVLRRILTDGNRMLFVQPGVV